MNRLIHSPLCHFLLAVAAALVPAAPQATDEAQPTDTAQPADAAQAVPADPPWVEQADPQITAVRVNPGDPNELLIDFTGEVGPQAATEAAAIATPIVGTVTEGEGGSVSATYTAKGPGGTIAVVPRASAEYEIQVWLNRAGENTTKYSERVTFRFDRVLAPPADVTAWTDEITGGLATVGVGWAGVAWADTYWVQYRKSANDDFLTAGSYPRSDFQQTGYITGRTPGGYLQLRVVAVRGDYTLGSQIIDLNVDADPDQATATPVPTTPPTSPPTTTPPTSPPPAPSPSAPASPIPTTRPTAAPSITPRPSQEPVVPPPPSPQVPTATQPVSPEPSASSGYTASAPATASADPTTAIPSKSAHPSDPAHPSNSLPASSQPASEDGRPLLLIVSLVVVAGLITAGGAWVQRMKAQRAK